MPRKSNLIQIVDAHVILLAEFFFELGDGLMPYENINPKRPGCVNDSVPLELTSKLC